MEIATLFTYNGDDLFEQKTVHEIDIENFYFIFFHGSRFFSIQIF